jgi:hypothetical protein
MIQKKAGSGGAGLQSSLMPDPLIRRTMQAMRN